MLANNLSPDSQMWARSLEKRLKDLEQENKRLNGIMATVNNNTKLALDINRRSEYVEGTVIKWLDSRHILVRLKDGTLVIVYVSPIYAAAIVIGGTIILNFQNGEYVIVDVVGSPAALVNTSVWNTIEGRLSALESGTTPPPPAPGPNLVPNPGPSQYQDNGTSPDLITSVSQTGWWSTAPEWGTLSVNVGILVHPAGYSPDSALVINGQGANSPESYLVGCVPVGTGAIPVSAGVDYSVSVFVADYYGSSLLPTATAGVRWYNSSGTQIGADDHSSAAAFAEDATGWARSDDTPETTWGCHPSATFPAPSGAAFACPITHIETVEDFGIQVRVSQFDFHRA